MTPRPARDLRQLIRGQMPHPPPVKFGQRRKGDVVDVKVQPHADGIGGHQIINIAVLIQCHLCVAGARAERPHHHRAAALGPADQLGNRIDIFNRKADDCAAFRHPAYLFRT